MMRRIVLVLLAMAVGLNLASAETRSERIKEHQERIRQILESSRVKRNTAQRREMQMKEIDNESPSLESHDLETTASAFETTVPVINDNSRTELHDRNKERITDFYYEGEHEPTYMEKHFEGDQQEYKDDTIQLKWKREEKGAIDFSGQWLESSHSIDFGKGSLKVLNIQLLKLRDQCYKIWSEGGYEHLSIKLHHWSQSKTINVYGDSYFMVSADYPQIVNDKRFFIKDNALYADDSKSSESIRIGNTVDDGRPLDSMYVSIKSIDTTHKSMEVQIDNAVYPHTAFATGQESLFRKTFEKSVETMTIATALERLGKAYGFEIEWANELTRSSALEMKQSYTGESGELWEEIEKYLQPNFRIEILSPDKIRVTLSQEYIGEQFELPQLKNQLNSSFSMVTKVYGLKRLSAKTVSDIIKDKLNGYAILKKLFYNRYKVIVPGEQYSIVKMPVKDVLRISDDVLNLETVVPDSEGNVVVVKALPETHEKIAAWLKEVDGSTQETALGPNDPAPERRRVQVVLLQGGKAGAAAEGTSATYSAAVPGEYGMTPDDLRVMGFDGAVELGRGLMEVVAKPGELGESTMKLGNRYPVSLAYKDERAPYLILDAKLLDDDQESLAENTVMLEKGKPAFLGVTNLSGAVIAVFTWLDAD